MPISIDLLPLRATAAEHVVAPLAIQLDAANPPVILEGKHFVSAVSRVSAGLFTLTLRDPWVAEAGAVFGLRAQTAVDLVPQEVGVASPGVTTVTKAGGQQIQVRLLAAAVPTDAPAKGANNCILTGTVVLRQTTLTS